MWFWNRREVYHGFIIFEQGKVREILSANQIKYDYKVVNKSGHGRGGNSFNYGRIGLNMNYEKEFYIYVSKENFDRAKELLREGLN